ncbi:YbjQ family protein [bacterium]|nr:YbjQ family protein [bacterium]
MFDLALIAGLIAVGYFFGGRTEKRHFQRLIKEEEELLHIPHSTLKKIPEGQRGEVMLVHTSVVLTQDYFKMIVAGFSQFFGGRIYVYETLLDRARREALVRLKRRALASGAASIHNLRLETSSISQQSNKKQVGTVEVIAYGTAVIPWTSQADVRI